ncbi:hypothetical protein K9E74_07595 [Staphylococcus pseudintermedius]|nr:hypothetical protein K9E74_07595 [Staphylococcus pseudintermedius]
MNGVDNIIINDGQEVSDNFIEEWDLEKYCKNYNGIKELVLLESYLKEVKL